MTQSETIKLIKMRSEGKTWKELAKVFKGNTPNALRKSYYRGVRKPKAKVLLLDIETAPILGYVWGLWENNLALNQVKQDWYILSWSAKWLGDPPANVMYADQRNAKNIEDDSKLLQGIWKLMDEADVIIGQNSKKFDIKKLNARFIQNGYAPPSSYRQIDTLTLAKKHFGFTSNKLEHMTDKLCVKYKKLKHSDFSGFELWKQCMANNPKAWTSMEKYNKYDVLSLEELYLKLAPWDKNINFNVFRDELDNVCNACGHDVFITKGFVHTNTGKHVRLVCDNCGHETKQKQNLLSKDKKKSLRT